MRSKIFIILVCCQLALAIFLGIRIYRLTKGFETKLIATTVDKRSVVLNPNSKLQNFYELSPNSTEVDTAPWLEEKIEYYINSDSLREDREYEVEKPDSTFRIVTLGDSFTFGAAVHLQDNYPKQLETLLNNHKCDNIQNFEVINLGVRGYDIEYAAERYMLRGEKYNPDLILWLLKNDDFLQIEEVMKPLTTEFLKEMGFKKKSGYLVNKNGSVSYPWYQKASKIMHKTYSDDEILDYQISAMNKMDNHYNMPLVILAFPSMQNKYNHAIRNFSNSRSNVYFYNNLIDPSQTNEAQPDGHPTAKGYSLIVEDVFDYIKNKSIITCD